MNKKVNYKIALNWIGNKGEGTSNYKSYARNHEIISPGKPAIPGSSDPAYLGDKARYNPEEMLVSALSACHMLWYLHLCAEAGVVVIDYKDEAAGMMIEDEERGGWFTEVCLYPKVVVTEWNMIEKALTLHEKAHSLCFIANSVNFPVKHFPYCVASHR